MNRVLWTLTSFAFAAAAAFALVTAGGTRVPDAGGRPDPVDRRAWTYTSPRPAAFRDLPERFDLAAIVELVDRSDCAVRFVINAERERGELARGIYVDVHRGGVTVGRIEGGLAVPRGRRAFPVRPGARRDVTVKRRGSELAVDVDGTLRCLSRDRCFAGGRLALGARGGARVSLKPLKRLPELPEFTDDFMRTEGDPSPWTVRSGGWENRSVGVPTMSANGFSYAACPTGVGEPAAFATAGLRTWDRYAVRSSVRPTAGGAVGVAIGVRDSNRYVLFRWSERSEESTGAREMVLVSPGEDGAVSETVLAREEGGYAADQWYRLTAAVSFGAVSVDIDGHLALEATCDEITSGGIGLWAVGPNGATFDDVVVSPLHAAAEPALAGVETYSGSDHADWSSRWDRVGGTWRLRGGVLEGSGGRSGDGKLLHGSGALRDFGVQARLTAQRSGRAGIVSNYRDETDHVLLTADFDSRRVLLERVTGGGRGALSAAPLPPASHFELRIENDRGHLAGSVNGRRLVEAWDRTAAPGRAGVFVGPSSRASFESFRSEALPHERPVPFVSPVFEVDKIMSDWARDSADWYRGKDSPGGGIVYWQSAPFHGDVELALDLPAMDLPRGSVVLGIAKSPDRPNNGYGWRLSPSPDGEGAGHSYSWHLSLTRAGAVVREVALESGQQVGSLFLRKCGDGISAGVDGEACAEFVDEDPLPGGRVAFLTRGVDVTPMNARLRGGHVIDCRFNEAPTDWRVGAGAWEIIHRWKCDPRWSFFGALWLNESPHKDSVVWHKRGFPGDVMVDVFVGPRMRLKIGERYQHARDFNVTIAADGKDVTSGYSFVFGGFDNSRSGIYRGTTPLVETNDLRSRITRGTIIHQRWYHIRVVRTGSTLAYRVDFNGRTILSLEVEDAAPLTGDHIAVWSHDCELALARVRIVAGSPDASPLAMEPPGTAYPEPAKTLYPDDQAVEAAHE